MAEFKATKGMERELDSFLATKTLTDVDRSKFITLALRDGVNKLATCLVFNCNCHSYEDPSIIPCEYTGAVIHLPAFWVEVPKELAFTYILNLVNGLYEDDYKDWKNGGFIGGNTGTDTPDNPSGGNNCGCGCDPTWNYV